MLPFREQRRERDLGHVNLDKVLQINLAGQESMQGCKNWNKIKKRLKTLLSLFPSKNVS